MTLMSQPKTLCLNMIVKNEMVNLMRYVSVVADHIADYVANNVANNVTDNVTDHVADDSDETVATLSKPVYLQDRLAAPSVPMAAVSGLSAARYEASGDAPDLEPEDRAGLEQRRGGDRRGSGSGPQGRN